LNTEKCHKCGGATPPFLTFRKLAWCLTCYHRERKKVHERKRERFGLTLYGAQGAASECACVSARFITGKGVV